MSNKQTYDFGDYVLIEQKRHGAPNEMYRYKVIHSLRSNSYVEVPVQVPETEILWPESEDVIGCICEGINERKVVRFRVKDVKRAPGRPTPHPGETTQKDIAISNDEILNMHLQGISLPSDVRFAILSAMNEFASRSVIEWAKGAEEEAEGPTQPVEIESFLHMDMPEYLKDGRDKGRFAWEQGYKAAALRFTVPRSTETPAHGEGINEETLHYSIKGNRLMAPWDHSGKEAAPAPQLVEDNQQKRREAQLDGYDDFCEAHQLPYNDECPECAEGAAGERPQEPAPAQQGEAPEEVYQWILAEADGLYEEGEHQQDFISGMTTMYRRDQEQIQALQDRLNRIALACQPIKDNPNVGYILKIAEQASR